MSHPDEEVLADLALGSRTETSAATRDHVDGCDLCTATVEELSHAMVLASRAELPPTWNRPPDSLWSRIEEAIVLESATPPGSAQEVSAQEVSGPGVSATEDLTTAEPSAIWGRGAHLVHLAQVAGSCRGRREWPPPGLPLDS